MRFRLLLGDCVVRMAHLEDASVQRVSCDPPYGLSFMGQEWDDPAAVKRARRGAVMNMPRLPHERSTAPKFNLMQPAYDLSADSNRAMQAWHQEWLAEAFRVLQPGGLVQVFGGTRTYHRVAAAMAGAGFVDIRLEAWTYGSGFPKSLDISKAIDKHLGVAPLVIAAGMSSDGIRRQPRETQPGGGNRRATYVPSITRSTSLQAQEWDGWGTALKPAWEPVLVGRKP